MQYGALQRRKAPATGNDRGWRQVGQRIASLGNEHRGKAAPLSARMSIRGLLRGFECSRPVEKNDNYAAMSRVQQLFVLKLSRRQSESYPQNPRD